MFTDVRPDPMGLAPSLGSHRVLVTANAFEDLSAPKEGRCLGTVARPATAGIGGTFQLTAFSARRCRASIAAM
jgi:hypothetical protein